MSQRGYTFVELVIAMAIMSMATLFLTTGILRLYHLYQNGLSIRNTQQSARVVADQITIDARTKTKAVAALTPQNVTVGAKTYQVYPLCFYLTSPAAPAPNVTIYHVNAQGRLIRHSEGIKGTSSTINPSSCDPTQMSFNSAEDQILTPDNVTVVKFRPPSTTPQDATVASVDLGVASNYDLPSVDANGACHGAVSQWCSVTNLQITINTRAQ
jgi:prepilin-type N-terminal cleavage/methylation domain-containing protein